MFLFLPTPAGAAVIIMPPFLHPSTSTSCPQTLASFHLFAPSASLSLSPSLPRRRRGLIIISQARPHQETWLLMREKSIRLFLSSLSLPASIYPPPSPPTHTHTHPRTHTPPTLHHPFLIRRIPRELGAISAAGTGVMCVFVCLRDLGAC